ncbi:MAG: hypothetical protein IKQ97_09895 [Eubacterium sp.]|nr:hypothetical protein [Eubacterium sp.]
MKHFWKRTAALVLTASLCLSSPAIAFAATETADTFEQLTKTFRDHFLSRDLNFDVQCNMPESEMDEHIFNEDGDFIDGMISMMDDPNTSDDADYIVGNISWEKGPIYGDSAGLVKFTLHPFETLPQTEYVNQHVPEILQNEIQVQNLATNYDKVKAIHDWVCKKITYTGGQDDIVSTCYGAITDGKVLCNGYSLCMYKLLVGAGIPCKYIGGTAGTERDAEGHAWNIVALGDKWYYVDATWDDEESRIVYDYFLKGSSDFDEADPTQPHKLDYGYTTYFAQAFPMAESAFNPKLMDSTNNTVKIGSEFPKELSVEPVNPTPGTKTNYTAADILDGTYPAKKTFTLRRNKTQHLQLFIKDEAYDLVDTVAYAVISGKKNVKSIKNNGFKVAEDDSNFTDLTFKGKKRGSVKIQIILTLTNKQEVAITFTGKIR